MSILLDSIQSNAFLSQLLQTSSTSTADSTSFSVSTEGTTDFAELLLKQLSSVTTSNDSSALQQQLVQLEEQLGQTTQTQSTTTNATKELIQLMTATAQLAMIQTLASQTDSSSSSKEDEAVENTAQSNPVATQSAALNQTSLF
ncbi:hypothetical protein AB0X74_13610 [Kurthia gibsonii]|uniref:hypothetical protein n=1 Tax=Kurthia TaxID=1649 RepID=UPI000745C65F|nr:MULTISPECIES: hypothetical protein [Kurthia]AMA64267.1 hypothetical protein ASO14_2329 [Kurthia sp. 11kri321]MEB6111917.1 hypothetical protein [Kurthia gibsonii]WIL39206.1 hypothetical protein QN089_02820 [Kurthia sp. YJT4]